MTSLFRIAKVFIGLSIDAFCIKANALKDLRQKREYMIDLLEDDFGQ